ncbi:MAG: 50S ribosomal protein L33 [Myxococcales bacterium]|nr:50S ribosomal protein L33 [Myxococcales bacterium]
MPRRESTRLKIVLACEKCGKRNYKTTRAPLTAALTVKKFCAGCNAHTTHHETK